jgi:tRNA 2-thiouridine synthesizing protein E
MLHIDLRDTRIELNREGFVADPSSWTREVAEHMAHRDGLALTEAHWEVIDYLRGYFEKYQIAPMIKIIAREISKTRPERVGTQYLYRLFPEGPAKQACRYAGLPRATGCV